MPIILPTPLVEVAPGIPFDSNALIVPAGIECPIERNGIVFNNRQYTEHLRVITIDGIDDADIRAIVENNPGDDGESVFDSPLYGGRTIVLNIRVEAQSLNSMRAMKQAAKSSFNDLKEHPLVFRTGNIDTDHQISCRKASIAGTETQGNNPKFTREMQITARASNPRFVSYAEHVKTVNLNSSSEILVTNLGNYRSTCRILIWGSASDISFRNLTTGQYMHLSSILTASDARMLNMEKLGVKIYDINDVTKYDELYDDAQRITLSPGDNVLQMVAAQGTFGSTAKLSVWWRDSWI